MSTQPHVDPSTAAERLHAAREAGTALTEQDLARNDLSRRLAAPEDDDSDLAPTFTADVADVQQAYRTIHNHLDGLPMSDQEASHVLTTLALVLREKGSSGAEALGLDGLT